VDKAFSEMDVSVISNLIAIPVQLKKSVHDVPTKKGAGEVIRLLHKAGADVDALNYNGTTKLFFLVEVYGGAAVESEYYEVVNALLECGARMDAVKLQNGRTLLHEAARSRSGSLIELLLNAGAKVGAKDSGGQTPLHLAAATWQNSGVIVALVKGGADPNARDNEGNAPIHFASHVDDANISALVRVGADINARNAQRKTRLDLCEHVLLERTLRGHGAKHSWELR
jgi:cytohesin